MTDMTIAAIHTSILRVPWPQTPWLKGHAFGDARNLLVLDVEDFHLPRAFVQAQFQP
jgi:hypothetical protein